MAKVRRASGTHSATKRVVGQEILRRARHLHADAVDVIAAYYDLAARYERLVTTVDVFWDEVAGIDDALLDVHESLGLHAVLLALEAAAQRFEEVGLVGFSSRARNAFGTESPPISELREAAVEIGTTPSKRPGRRGRG